MYENKRKKCIFGSRMLSRAVSVLIVLVMVFLLLPATVMAVQVTQTSNTYIISLGTGRAPGDCIRYIAVKYRDYDSGNVRTEFIFPQSGDLEKSILKATKADSRSKRSSTYNKYTGETVPTNGSGKAALSCDTLDSFIFEPSFRVDKIISVDVYMNFTSGKNSEWTCTGLRVYNVDRLYGVGMYGYCSADKYLEFDGTLVASLAPEGTSPQNKGSGKPEGDVAYDFNCDGMDKLYRFGVDRLYSEMGQLYWMEGKNEAYSNASNAKKLFRMDIADMNAAGIEALSTPVAKTATKFTDMKFREALAVEIKYRDIYGGTRKAEIPVATSFSSWVIDNFSEVRNQSVIGIVQQDDTVLFNVYLPDFGELTGVSLNYNENVESLCGINPSSSAEAEMAALKSCPTSPDSADILSIVGLSIFGSEAKYDVKVDGGRLKCVTSGTPQYYFKTSNYNGISINYGSNAVDLTANIKQGTQDTVLTPEKHQWTYVVEIDTDTAEIASAATKENINARFHYLSKKGQEKTGDTIKLRSAASEFTGYWAGTVYEGNTQSRIADTPYRLGTACDGKIIFGLDYTDVDYFTGVTLFMDENVIDEWQMSGIKIYRVSYVSDRMALWVQTGFTESDRAKHNDVMTDRWLYRDYDKSVCVRTYNKEKVLLYEKGNSKRINFDEENGGTVEDNPINWNEIKEEMDYETTEQDLGFSKGLCEYEVRVKVKSNAGINGDDDCGSKNKFYFKLVFEDGTSAYVLANQQLLADGFRAGQTESFKITTNRDYGDLSAVYIIPDDIQEDSVPMDKLNIESLTVINTSDTGVSRTWKCSCAGGGEWIAVKYVQDAGAQGTAGGQQGRSEMSLANVLTVDSVGYSLNFLFTIKTTGYTAGYPPFDGTLMAKITYKDAQSRQQQMSVDVIRAMYNYMGKEPQWSKELVGDESGDYLAVANPALMLRENHVDRFIVTIPDVSQIVGIEFFGSYSKGDGSLPTTAKITEWIIGGVEVHIIKESGALELNNFNEYKRTDVVERLCGSVNPQGYRFQISSSSEKNNLPLIFDTGTIDISENGTWKTNTAKEPANNNDTLNLYVYMADSADTKAEYTMNASVIYLKRDDDKVYQTYVKNMTRSKDGKMFSKIGLSAKSLSTIYQLTLKANSFNNPYATVDKVVVQHVRSGVVINNYVFNFAGRDVCFSEIALEPSGGSALDSTSEKQVVMLQLSDDTQTTALEKDIDDMNVSIRYTTTNDSGKETYNSKTISLSSAGIGTVSANKVLRLEFNEPYVKEVTGVNVQSVGDVKASVDCACVETLTSDSANKVSRTGWYNFGGSDGRITYQTKTLTRSNTTVVPLKLSFIVANATRSTMPVRMNLKVLDRVNDERTDKYVDINKYITSGSFMAGKTVTAEMLVRDVSALRSLTLSPYDDTSDVMSLELASVLAEWTINGTDASVSRNVNAVITEGGEHIVNLSNITVEYNAVSYDADGNSNGETNSHTDGTASSITIKSGGHVIVKPKVIGTLPGYSYTYDCVLIDGDMNKKADYCVLKDGMVIFQPPVNNTGADVKYRLTFVSEELPSDTTTATLIVTVKPVPIPVSDSDNT